MPCPGTTLLSAEGAGASPFGGTMRFYLAAPFFSNEQLGVVNHVEDMSDQLGHECFSPRTQTFCPPDATIEQRKASFEANVRGIINTDFVLARIDDFDPGTIWELGYAYRVAEEKRDGAVHPLKIYAFTTVPGRGLNLMLAQGVDGFIQGLDGVQRFLEGMQTGDDSEAKKWMQRII